MHFNPLSIFPMLNYMEQHERRDGMLAGLDQLMGALSNLSISTDKTTYKVGETPTYRISGGVPLGHVAWTSFKNGQPTGEFQADYPGDDLNESGALTVRAGAWSASDIGDWVKEILIVPPDYAQNPDYGSLHIARVEFSVVPASAAVGTGQSTATTQQSSGTGILNQQVDIPIIGKVPVIAVAGIAGVGLLLLMGSGGKR